jgi:hypothetical protein
MIEWDEKSAFGATPLRRDDFRLNHSRKLVDLTWASSNQIREWLRQLDGLRTGDLGKSA